jgi:hypothetical protein
MLQREPDRTGKAGRAAVEWLLAALAAVACFMLPVLILSSPGHPAGTNWLWPLPGLILLGMALLGLAGFAGIVGLYPRVFRGPAAAWAACGALTMLGVVGWIGMSVVFFALVPAVLFGLSTAFAERRRRG